MDDGLCQLEGVYLCLVFECGEKFVQEIEVEPDVVSDNNCIFSKEIFYLGKNGLSCWCRFQFADRESGDKSYDVFEFICFFVGFDEGLIFADDFSCSINFDNPYLDRFVFADVESCSFEVETYVSIFWVE